MTCRLTHRTWLAAVARDHRVPVLLRLAGNGSRRYPPASIGAALASQFAPPWESPLDRWLRAEVEGDRGLAVAA